MSGEEGFSKLGEYRQQIKIPKFGLGEEEESSNESILIVESASNGDLPNQKQAEKKATLTNERDKRVTYPRTKKEWILNHERNDSRKDCNL